MHGLPDKNRVSRGSMTLVSTRTGRSSFLNGALDTADRWPERRNSMMPAPWYLLPPLAPATTQRVVQVLQESQGRGSGSAAQENAAGA